MLCYCLAVHFRLTPDIFAVLYKYLNCAADKGIEAGHTAITDCKCQLWNNTINYVIYYFLVQEVINKLFYYFLLLLNLNI